MQSAQPFGGKLKLMILTDDKDDTAQVLLSFGGLELRRVRAAHEVVARVKVKSPSDSIVGLSATASRRT